MVLRRGARIPLRRETLATRRLRARLARERQGPDGKWETNKKKREVRTVKKHCTKLQTAFELGRAKQAKDQAVLLNAAKALLIRLAKVSKSAALMECVGELDTLGATSSILRRCQLVDVLVNAAKRCRKGKDERVTSLLAKWRRILEDHEPPKRAKRQSLRSQPSDSGIAISAAPRYVTPLRPKVIRPSWKLGKLFSAIRSKHANAEVSTLKNSQELSQKLQDCANAKSLRKLLPSLQELTLTSNILQQVRPNLVEALETIAKRCRMGKDASVVDLLTSWKEFQTTASGSKKQVKKRMAGKRKLPEQVKVPEPASDLVLVPSPVMTAGSRDDGGMLTQAGLSPTRNLPLPSKQLKLTAFLSGGEVSAPIARLGA